jgi:hypothetical protein
MIGKSTLGSSLREICTMGSERGDEYKRPCSLGEGTGSKESEYSEAPQRATTSRLVPTHQQDHRAIKRRYASMAGFKSFANAAIHDCRHRACASDSQGTILAWPWASTSWLVAEGEMGNGTRRIEDGREAQKAAN